jgi:hypothetical protein
VIAALLLAAALCPHPSRSRSVIEEFKELTPCPASCATYVRVARGRYRVYQQCGACQVDHKCPRAWCGKDDAANLQWLTSKENRKKSDSPAQCTYEDVDWDEVDRAITEAVRRTDQQKAAAIAKLKAELDAIIQKNTSGP